MKIRKSNWHVDLRCVPLKFLVVPLQFSVRGHSAPSEKSESGALKVKAHLHNDLVSADTLTVGCYVIL